MVIINPYSLLYQLQAEAEAPHLYLHIGEAASALPRVVVLEARVAAAPSRWRVKVSQVRCDGAPLQAPDGCAQVNNNLVFILSFHILCPQYYTEPSGTITSLNLPDRLYPANLDMAVCIRPDLASCGIEYK